MKEQIKNISPTLSARLAGVLFLLTMLFGGFAKGFIAESILIPGDPTGTATIIMTKESLFRLGFALYIVEMACQIAMMILFYDILKPINRSISKTATAFGLTGCGIKIISRLFFIAPLAILSGNRYLTVFSTEQLQALALLSFNIEYLAESIAVIFFGLNTVLYGYLFIGSTFLPKILGALSVISGLGWLTYLYEPLGARLAPFIVGVALIGALATALWLIIFGVDERKWKEQAGVG